ncbi:MAG: DUF1275 domain-containing protein [Eubacteriaceae bacterium]|jgi:uncharacterized membrane protein YoaK (UPF0700 family)|nr:DUF1275 domain-containing protein [Eubacteriaceae bacterium]
MNTEEKEIGKAPFNASFVTSASIFILGYLNAFALNTHDLGTMITAQSGNVIWLGINAASGYWGLFFDNFSLFIGFIAGAVFAAHTQSLQKNMARQFFFNWSMFAVPVVIYPLLMQYVVPSYISFIVLGFVSGIALGYFRQLHHLEINNAMATGNVRFLGLHFAGAFLKKNKKEAAAFWTYFVCVFLYAFGAFVYTKLAQMDFKLGLAGRGFIIGLGDHSKRKFRQSLGFSEYRTDVVSSNVIRLSGLFVSCIVPYFFYPKKETAYAEE